MMPLSCPYQLLSDCFPRLAGLPGPAPDVQFRRLQGSICDIHSVKEGQEALQGRNGCLTAAHL